MTLLLPAKRFLLGAPWLKNELWRRAKAVPSLDLRFAENRSLVDATTGLQLVTFSRTSSATFVDGQGVIRNAVTNLNTNSEAFDTYGAASGSVAANQGMAPNGTLTADEITSTGGGAFKSISGTSASTKFTASVYAKYVSGSGLFSFGFDANPTQGRADFNLQTGALGAGVGTNVVSRSITPVGDGWYRCSVTAVATSTSVVIVFYNGTSGAKWLCWGAQLEQSSSVGEYIPTGATINSAPRFDHNPITGESLGLLVEEQRTNSIRNNTMAGAVAGTPGTLPTNWAIGNQGTLSSSVVGVGTEDGISYIDLRINGTSSTSGPRIRFEDLTVITAASGQSWNGSFYIRQVGGSTTNLTGVSVDVFTRDTAQTTEVETFPSQNIAASLGAASLARNRVAVTGTLANASSTRVCSRLTLNCNSGVAIDITLRIGLPQLEQGAFATSVIPTSGTAATRAADVASISGSNFSSWFNANQGSVFIEAQTASANAGFITFRDASAAEYIRMGREFNFLSGVVSKASGNSATLYSGQTLSLNAPFKGALGYAADNFALVQNGGSPIVDTSGALPDPANELTIGQGRYLAPYINGPIRRLTYWPVRLGNENLQRITQ